MLSNIIPLLILFALGYILKKLGVFRAEDARFLLKFVFFVSAPGLVLYSFPKIRFESSLFYLSLIAVLISLTCFLLSSFLFRLFRFSRTSKGETKATFIISTMIMNTSLLVAVAFSLFNAGGVVRAQMFDFGNAVMVFSLVYFIASYFNPKNINLNMNEKFVNAFWNLLKAPPLWAMVIGIFLSVFSINVPAVIDSTFNYLGASLIPLVLLSLGIYFELKIEKPILTLTAVSTRILFGLGLGFLFAFIFKLQGVDKLIVLLGASAPAGFNTLVFSSINDLDEGLGASIVSMTILIDIFLIPILVSLI